MSKARSYEGTQSAKLVRFTREYPVMPRRARAEPSARQQGEDAARAYESVDLGRALTVDPCPHSIGFGA